jgi:DNA polymerase-3 subunit beta
MRFTIDKDQFLKGLSIAEHAVGAKSTNPVLLCFKLELTAKGLEVTGSNNEIAIFTTVPNSLNGKDIIRNGAFGSALINAHTLTEIVRKIESPELSVEIIDNAIAKIDGGQSSFKLVCMSADEYPDIDLEQSTSSFSMPCVDLIGIVNQTAFAAFAKDTKPILTAVNLKAEGGKLIATATDSARLSRKTVDVDPGLHFSMNVPARTLQDVIRLLDPGDNVEIGASPEKIIFSFGNTIVTSRLVHGDYPVSNSIIPSEFNYYLEVNAAQFLSALDRVSTLSITGVPVEKLSMSEEAVEISSSEKQTGSGVERLTTVQYSGERLEIAFNANFVADAVKAVGSEDVTIQFIAEMKPFVIRNPRDDSVIELITPMRTR